METHEDHHGDTCLWCLLLQLQRLVVSVYLDEMLGTPGRTFSPTTPFGD